MQKSVAVIGLLWIVAGIILVASATTKPKITIRWETETEYETVGFNVLRSESETGNFAPINARLIPASQDPSTGGTYSYIDHDVLPEVTYYYQLEDIELDGTSSTHELLVATAKSSFPWVIFAAVALLLIGILGVILSFRKEKLGN